MISAHGMRRVRSRSIASGASSRSPEVATITGSSTTCAGFHLLQPCDDRVDRIDARDHADLHRLHVEVGEHRIDLRGDEIRRRVVDAGHALRVLRGQRGDDGGTVDAERGERLQVGLDAGAAAGIRAGDGERDRDLAVVAHASAQASCSTISGVIPCRQSRIATARLPGPSRVSAASSPAMPNTIIAAAVASQRSSSTASAARDERRSGAAHGGDLAHQFVAIVQVDQPLAVGDDVDLAGQRDDRAALRAQIFARSRPRPPRPRARQARPHSGGSPQAFAQPACAQIPAAAANGRRTRDRAPMAAAAAVAASSAMPMASRRSRSSVPRLTSRLSAPATKPAISSGEVVTEGVAPAASSVLAVNACATVLVMQCTRGFFARIFAQQRRGMLDRLLRRRR